MFLDPIFARFVGTRCSALFDSELFKFLDEAHGGAISALQYGEMETEAANLPDSDPMEAVNGHGMQQNATQEGDTSMAGSCDEDEDDYLDVDPDPCDDIPPPEGKRITVFFSLFVDGVQLNQHGRATTVVVALKCLDLPGFLYTTDCAAYPLAFISGPKDPTNLTEILRVILDRFKEFEPVGVKEEDGKFFIRGTPIKVFDSYRRCHREVFPIFVLAFADTPARRGWLLSTGHTSRSGCDKCGIRSVRKLPGGGTLDFNGFAGYTAAVPAKVYDSDDEVWSRKVSTKP